MVIKEKKNQAKLNSVAEDFSFKKFVYLQGSPALCQPFVPNKPCTPIINMHYILYFMSELWNNTQIIDLLK